MSKRPYTAGDIHNAELILQHHALRAADGQVRARAQLVLSLISLLDASSLSWRAELAAEISAALEADQLPNFDRDAPFNLLIGNTEYLSTLQIGHLDGAALLKDFANVYGGRKH